MENKKCIFKTNSLKRNLKSRITRRKGNQFEMTTMASQSGANRLIKIEIYDLNELQNTSEYKSSSSLIIKHYFNNKKENVEDVITNMACNIVKTLTPSENQDVGLVDENSLYNDFYDEDLYELCSIIEENYNTKVDNNPSTTSTSTAVASR